VRDVIRETALPQQAPRTLTLRLLALGNRTVAVATSDEGGVVLQDAAGIFTMTETDTMTHVIGCQSNGIDSGVGRLLDGKSGMFEKSETLIGGTVTTGGFLESTTLTLALQALRNPGYEHWTRIVAQVLLTCVIFQGHLQD
jgi:hypothetical protein